MEGPRTFPQIIQETESWLAVNKPAGWLSIPDREGKEPSVKSWLIGQNRTVFTVHRIDRDTSGLLLFAKTAGMHRHLSGLFESRQTEKIYLGFVSGVLSEKKKTIDAPIRDHFSIKGKMQVHAKGKPSITEYEVLEEWSRLSWLQFRLLTGRTHQIRVHLQNEGHPLLCDPLYGDGAPVLLSSFKKRFNLSRNEESERPLLSRLALHASVLGFEEPGGSYVRLEAPLPKDLQALLQQLRKHASR